MFHAFFSERCQDKKDKHFDCSRMGEETKNKVGISWISYRSESAIIAEKTQQPNFLDACGEGSTEGAVSMRY